MDVSRLGISTKIIFARLGSDSERLVLSDAVMQPAHHFEWPDPRDSITDMGHDKVTKTDK